MNGSLTLPAQAGSLDPAMEFVRKAAREANLPDDRTGQVELIVEEIIMNLSLHAYPEGAPGDVVIAYSIPAVGTLCVEVADRGREFDPLASSAPDLTLDLAGRPVGGLGIFLIRSFADSLAYRRDEGWNRLSFAVSAR
jgi:anti-sigma regulatory factor (Ser/Thr protein kinase)